MALTFVLGGARSGKSGYAQRLTERAAEASGRPPVMIATAEALDQEMAERIAAHRKERGEGWRLVEAPLDLLEAIRALKPGEAAVVDCLTLWLSNLMLGGHAVEEASARLMEALAESAAEIALVSNEVGMSLTPDHPLGRRFRDAQGRLNQEAAAAADHAVLMVCGLGLVLKGRPLLDPTHR